MLPLILHLMAQAANSNQGIPIVQLYAVAPSGRRLDMTIASVLDAAGRDMAGHAAGLTLSNMRPGFYGITLHYRGSSTQLDLTTHRLIDGTSSLLIVVDERPMLVAGQTVVAMDSVGCQSQGKIKGEVLSSQRGPGVDWVRLTPVFHSTPPVDSVVDPEGRYSFSAPKEGRYILQWFRNGELLGVEARTFHTICSDALVNIRPLVRDGAPSKN